MCPLFKIQPITVEANVCCKIPSHHCHFRLVQPLLSHGKVCRTGTGSITCQMRLPGESHGMCWTNSHFTQSPVEQRPPHCRTNNLNPDTHTYPASSTQCDHSLLQQFAQLDITPLEKAARWTEADHQESSPDSQALRPVWEYKRQAKWLMSLV